MSAHPPGGWQWLLRRVVPREHRESLSAELHAGFEEERTVRGEGAARRWYHRQVLAAMRPDIAHDLWLGDFTRWPVAPSGLSMDVRHTLRRWRRRPGLVAGAIVVIAVGAGGAAAVQGIFASLLRSPVRLAEVEQVLILTASDSAGATKTAFGSADALALRTSLVSRTAGTQALVWATVRQGETAVWGRVADVNAAWFDVVRAVPATGRQPRSPGEVLISDSHWRTQFGGSAEAVGQTIHIDRAPYVVVGVTPRGFHPPGSPLLWRLVDEAATSAEEGTEFLLREADPSRRAAVILAAGSALGAVDRQSGGPVRTAALRPVAEPAAAAGELNSLARARQLMTGLALLLLLSGIANAANLIGGESARRGGELSLRKALGASRVRLFVQLLGEGLLLGAAAALAALAVAWTIIRIVPGWLPVAPGSRLEIGLPLRAIAVAIGLAITAAIAASVLPGWAAARGAGWLRARSGPAGAGRSTTRTRDVLAAVQVAQAVVLIATAVVFARSMASIRALAPGYEPDRTAVVSLTMPRATFDSTRLVEVQRRALATLATQPGVQAVSWVTPLPLLGWVPRDIRIAGDGTTIAARELRAGAAFFDAAGTRIIRGAAYRDGETGTAVVTETLARALREDGDVVGHTLDLGRDMTVRITGVAEAGTWGGITPAPMLFRSLQPGEARSVALLLRLDRTGPEATAGLITALRTVDADLPATAMGSLDDLLDRAHLLSRGLGALAALFAALALAVGALGLHANLAHRIAVRTREIGIRLALGASPGRIVGEFTRAGFRVVACGLAAGLLLAVAATRLLSAMVFGVHPLDPWVLFASTLMLTLVAAAATIFPARLAARIDPALTLSE